MNTKEYLQQELNIIRYKPHAPIKLLESIINHLPKEPLYHDRDILYTESDGDGYVVEYKMRRVINGIENVYCRYDLNLRTGEFEDNPRHLIYQNCIFRRSTPDEQKKLEEAIRRSNKKGSISKNKMNQRRAASQKTSGTHPNQKTPPSHNK